MAVHGQNADQTGLADILTQLERSKKRHRRFGRRPILKLFRGEGKFTKPEAAKKNALALGLINDCTLMPKLGNYITGSWITGDGDGQPLFNAATGEIITHASTKGLDFASILDYGR